MKDEKGRILPVCGGAGCSGVGGFYCMTCERTAFLERERRRKKDKKDQDEK